MFFYYCTIAYFIFDRAYILKHFVTQTVLRECIFNLFRHLSTSLLDISGVESSLFSSSSPSLVARPTFDRAGARSCAPAHHGNNLIVGAGLLVDNQPILTTIDIVLKVSVAETVSVDAAQPHVVCIHCLIDKASLLIGFKSFGIMRKAHAYCYGFELPPQTDSHVDRAS